MDVAEKYKFYIIKLTVMKKSAFQFLLCLCLYEFFILNKTLNAFLPIINEPNKEELDFTSIQLGRRGLQLIQFGQNNEAIKLLELAVKLNPKEKNLWLQLAEAQIRSNKNDEAISSLNKALKLKPEEFSIYFAKASIYMNLNNPQKAKLFIKKGLSIDKNNERGYFLLGNAEIMLKNYKSALKAFKKSSDINPKFWQSINNEGLVLYELNYLEEAILKFKTAIRISNNPEPMLALAVVLFSKNSNPIDSINLAKNALGSEPNYVSKEYQAKQLWGKKLQKSAQLFFKIREMETIVNEAKEKNK